MPTESNFTVSIDIGSSTLRIQVSGAYRAILCEAIEQVLIEVHQRDTWPV
jgi:hypothetical protein